MAKVIWKYALNIESRQEVVAPIGIEWLHLGVQGDTPVLWGLCDPEQGKHAVPIYIVGTGNPFEPGPGMLLEHLGTCQIGPFVWHVFEDQS